MKSAGWQRFERSRCTLPTANHTPAVCLSARRRGCCGRCSQSVTLTLNPMQRGPGGHGDDQRRPGRPVLLDDLLGIGDTSVALPDVTPEARQRRLTALVRSGILADRASALYVIEDAHWIDEASESLFVELAAALPETRSLILITHRPDYTGALTGGPGRGGCGLDAIDRSAHGDARRGAVGH